jgi:hypothetical protein
MAKILETVGLTVDQLIAALQKASYDGFGKVPAEVLVGGDHTGPVRAVEVIQAFAGTVVLLTADDDQDAAGTVLRARGNSLTG